MTLIWPFHPAKGDTVTDNDFRNITCLPSVWTQTQINNLKAQSNYFIEVWGLNTGFWRKSIFFRKVKIFHLKIVKVFHSKTVWQFLLRSKANSKEKTSQYFSSFGCLTCIKIQLQTQSLPRKILHGTQYLEPENCPIFSCVLGKATWPLWVSVFSSAKWS